MGGDRPKYGFEDLEVYRLARDLRVQLYGLARKLPEFEKYNLISQLRRASLSLTNNIAEGHGRYHYLENIHFLLQARGSLQEIMDDLNVCSDEKYLEKEALMKLEDEAYFLLKKLNGYMLYLRKRKQRDQDDRYSM